MKTETNEIRKLSSMVKVLIVCMIIALTQSVIKNFINEKWARERDTIACLPNDTETAYTGVYLTSAAHPVNTEAKIQSFVEQYVYLTRNESIIDFHKVINDPTGRRYDKAVLSANKWKAIFMSEGAEKSLNEKKYIESTDVFNFLDKKKMGIVFLIDEIIVNPVPLSQNSAVIVRGQYEGIYDQAEKDQELPAEFLGYREIRYIIQMDFARLSSKDNESFENKFGYYVIWSDERVLSSGEKTALESRSKEQFLREHGDFSEFESFFGGKKD